MILKFIKLMTLAQTCLLTQFSDFLSYYKSMSKRGFRYLIAMVLILFAVYSTSMLNLFLVLPYNLRLHQIDAMEKRNPDAKRVLHIDKLIPLTDRLQYFSISHVSHKLPKARNCPPVGQTPIQALLFIAASPFDPISMYSKIMRQFELMGRGEGTCGRIELYLLRRLWGLSLSTEDKVSRHTAEVGQIIKYFTVEAEYELSILTHQQGALLTLNYLATRPINRLFENIVDKLKTLVLIDVDHPWVRLWHDPPRHQLDIIRRQIDSQPALLQIFNKLRIVLISSLNKDYQIYPHPFPYKRTILINTRMMANLHEYLPVFWMNIPAFSRRLGAFIAMDFSNNLTMSQVASVLRHGHSHPFELVEATKLQSCKEAQIKPNSRFKIQTPCLTLRPTKLNESESVLVQGARGLMVYSDEYERVFPFDNLTEISTFIFQRLQNRIFIVSPQSGVGNDKQIRVTRQVPAVPSNCLKSDDGRLVRLCPDTILSSPGQIPLNTQLVTDSQKDCFKQSFNVPQRLFWQCLEEWSFFRNILIFNILICEYRRKYTLSSRLLEHTIITMILMTAHSLILPTHFVVGLYIVCLALAIQCTLKLIIFLCSFLSVRKGWDSFVLLGITACCFVGSTGMIFNAWSLFLFAVIFFVNYHSINIFLLKLYFIREDVLFQHSSQNLTDLGLLAMWLYTSLPSRHDPSSTGEIAQKFFKGMLLAGIGLWLPASGSTVQLMLTIYMKVVVVVRILGITRK